MSPTGKGKGKKGKGKKGKGGKGKKAKPLPGEKLGKLKGMDPENMLSLLVENKFINGSVPRTSRLLRLPRCSDVLMWHLLLLLVVHALVRYRDKKMSDLIGEFNYLGSLHHYGDRKGPGKWEPQV